MGGARVHGNTGRDEWRDREGAYRYREMPGRVYGAALSGREHRGVPGGLPGLPGEVPGPRIAGPYRGVPRRYRLVPTGEVPHE